MRIGSLKKVAIIFAIFLGIMLFVERNNAALAEDSGIPNLIFPLNNDIISGTSVAYSWDFVPGAKEYSIYVSTTPDFKTENIKINRLTNSISYTDTNYPNNGTRYYWLVYAWNGTVWSQSSVVRSFYNSPSNASTTTTSPRAPTWTDSLIIYQMRLDQFTPEGTIKAAKDKLSYLQDLGITAVLLNPIAEFKTADKNKIDVKDVAYGTLEPDKLEYLLGTEQDFKDFVNDAHLRGIKVFVDVVTLGVEKESSFLVNHPDWFLRYPNGTPQTHAIFTLCYMWNYSNPEFRSWWENMIVNQWVLKYNLDGLRLDLEPYITNYIGVWTNVRNLAKQNGKDIVLFSEGRDSDDRHNEVHFTEWGFGVIPPWLGIDFLDKSYNIVDVIKSKDYKEIYYTSTLSYTNTGASDAPNQNGPHYNAKGELVYFGYGMLLAPFIPVWYMGEEFNNTCTVPNSNGDQIINCAQYQNGSFYDRLYYTSMKWQNKTNNQDFLNKVKKLIWIRKEYRDIIAPFSENLYKTPITKVNSIGTDLQSYALYKDNVSIIVVGKKDSETGNVNINIQLSQMGMIGYANYSVTDLMNDQSVIVSDSQLNNYNVYVEKGGIAVLKIEQAQKSITPTNNTQNTTTNTTCPTCPSPTTWSACSNNIQTRNNYRCNVSTSYLCQSYTESQSCIVTPNNTTTPNQTQPTHITPPVNHTQNIPTASSSSPIVINIPTKKSEELKVDEVKINVNDIVTNIDVIIKDTSPPQEIMSSLSTANGVTYKYLDITTTVPKDKMEEVIIKFKVEKSWIEENDINSSTIALNRYSDNIWTKLDTRSTNDDITYYYFESESSGFSIFAITGEKNIATIPPENKNIIWIYVVVGIGVITFLGGLFYYVNKKQERKEFDELKEKYKE